MKFLFILALLTCSAFGKEKVIYKYKQYEKVDLGNLEVKGQIIAPGDISVKERARTQFDTRLYNRIDFKDKILRDIRTLH